MVIGRFAPSPSGRMHLGNVFAALCAWLGVRSQGGRMLLRVEDLDPQRSRPEHTQALLRDLDWLGLDWDQRAPDQSTRTAFYEVQLEKLQEMGLVYPCFCSRAELHSASGIVTDAANNPANAPHAGGDYVYNGRCAALSAAEQAARMAQGAAGRPSAEPARVATQATGRAPALRLRVPDEEVCLEDAVQGPYCENLARQCGDFIIRRSDGVFAYQLAAPCDDADQGVTQVVRGRDLLASAPRQSWLLRTLGHTPPQYAHLPLLVAPDGRRLSKRERDLDLGALRAKGKRPEEIIGALAGLCGLADTMAPVAARDLLLGFDFGRICKSDLIIEPDILQ